MYHVFAFDQYYPTGGIQDYKGSFETLEEAKEDLNIHWLKNYNWAEILTEKEGILECIYEYKKKVVY